jgi:multidrug resistance efflux pump
MPKSFHILLAGSISLATNLACAGPLDLLFGGEPKAGAAGAAPAAFKKLGDSELRCEALYAEVHQLETLVAKSQSDAKSQAASETTKRIASGLAQNLISAAPLFGDDGRSGMLAGMVVSQAAAAQAQHSAHQAQQVQMDAATASRRRDHLVNLFDEKRCRVSELKK